jgi:hypothetical protein
LKAGKASAVAVVDWDRDGDLDLLVGNIEGHVSFVRNEGSRERPLFATPVRLEAEGKAIQVPGGDAGPFTADWNGDGLVDLLVGCGDGSVLLYPNTADSGLAAPLTLVRKSPSWGESASGTKIERGGARRSASAIGTTTAAWTCC